MENICIKQATQASTNDAPKTQLAFELTDGFARRCIRRKARQLVGKAGITASDRPDLEQEMTLVSWSVYHDSIPSGLTGLPSSPRLSSDMRPCC